MSIAFSLLLICIVFASGTALQDGAAPQSLLAAFIVTALVVVAVSARAADVKFVAQVTKGLKLVAAVPAVWMLVQILPTPIGAHSIWSYANETLGRETLGHITIDLGATTLALAWYLANLALVIVAIFVTTDRRRAELVLFVLTGATAATSVALLAAMLGLLPFLQTNEGESSILNAVAGFGILLALTTSIRGIERYESQSAQSGDRHNAIHIQATLLFNGLALLCCVGALVFLRSFNIGFIVAFASLVFASVQIIRRIGMGGWATIMLLTTMALAAAMVVIWKYDTTRLLSPLLQFANASPDSAQRMLADSGLKGFGAGTFASALPLYESSVNSGSSPPTTISAIAIELGWPLALAILAFAFLLLSMLYRGALNRGRDSFYPILSAACIVIAVGQAFCDPSLLHPSVAIIFDAIIGLGLAQSVSQRGSQ